MRHLFQEDTPITCIIETYIHDRVSMYVSYLSPLIYVHACMHGYVPSLQLLGQHSMHVPEITNSTPVNPLTYSLSALWDTE